MWRFKIAYVRSIIDQGVVVNILISIDSVAALRFGKECVSEKYKDKWTYEGVSGFSEPLNSDQDKNVSLMSLMIVLNFVDRFRKIEKDEIFIFN